MTNPPQSPYGPADSQPPQPPQQPYNAAQLHPYEQAPYGYTIVGRNAPTRGNGPGLAALIVGIVAVVTAFIPFVNFFAFALGPAGIILGIIGLVLVERPRKQAAWGTALSAASLVIAFIMVFVYTFGFLFAVGGAVDEATRNLPTVEPSPFDEETTEPIEPVGDPLPLGTVVELTDDTGAVVYEATVSASLLDATDLVSAIAVNPDAPAGMQWAMVTVDLTSRSATPVAPAVTVTVDYVTADGSPYSRLDAFAIAPDPSFDALFDVGTDESVRGNIVIAIPSDAPSDGVWLLSSDGGKRFYFTVQ